MSIRLHAVLMICIMGMSTHTFADELLKFGFVNTERVYRESKTAQTVQKRLEKEFATKRDVLKKLESEGVSLQKELSKSNISASDRLRLERELAALDRNYRAASEELAQDFTLRRNEEFAAIQERANRLIKEMAEKGDFDLILQDAVYVKPKFDLTGQLIKALDN
ncbi:OmpH family outer membrane protein [Neisseria sp. Ec49-e6-T10]|uniref:OmpH family outer membrane protein n=1 Tax=Neisseria sp. Ec49-e6-T10 TaxID=3140744 RepID=UPI003EBCB17D